MDNKKKIYSKEDVIAYRKDAIFQFVCVLLAIVIVCVSCYFIFREKYHLEIEVRLEFFGGEYRLRENDDRYYAWHIPYDGEQHYPILSFWDGKKQIYYTQGSDWGYEQYYYYFKRQSDGRYFHDYISEKGVYELWIDVGAHGPRKDGKSKYLSTSKHYTVIIY